jgi:sigma-B regulation protein RsbU (phosphoserine phosphatase)
MNGELIGRWLQFGQLVAGVLIFTAGAVQYAFSRPFCRERNPALAVLGVAGVLYGARLLGGQPEVRALTSASPLFWLYFDTFITYVVLVPILYFYELTFGTGWRQSIRWLRLIVTGYAVAAIVIDSVTRTPRAAKGLNGPLVITAIVLLVTNSMRPGAAFSGLRIVRAGLITFASFVLFENIVNDRFLHGGWNIEWMGTLALLGCLGYVAVSRAVENDRQLHDLQRELETARQIQTSILPQWMPAVDGVGLAARYLPMTSVAGDFYDFLELGSGRLGVLVADVSGHGVPAALIASMVKVALVAQVEHADDPALVLAGMNRIFSGRLERQFVTAAYVHVDPVDGRLRYGAAGHPPALLISREGSVEEIPSSGVMLGPFPQWTYTSVERPFRPGDRLILYTDGLIEATDTHGDFFDRERLRAFASNSPARTADVFAGALLDHVGTWSGRTAARGFDDDVTIVVVDGLSPSGSI